MQKGIVNDLPTLIINDLQSKKILGQFLEPGRIIDKTHQTRHNSDSQLNPRKIYFFERYFSPHATNHATAKTRTQQTQNQNTTSETTLVLLRQTVKRTKTEDEHLFHSTCKRAGGVRWRWASSQPTTLHSQPCQA